MNEKEANYICLNRIELFASIRMHMATFFFTHQAIYMYVYLQLYIAMHSRYEIIIYMHVPYWVVAVAIT